MTGQRAIAIAVLVASLFVLGTMSASLGATVTSTPNDAIDVDTDSLPFMGNGANEIADSYRSAKQGTTQARTKDGEDPPSKSSGGEPPGSGASDAGDDGRPQANAGQPNGDGSSDGSSQRGESGDQGASGKRQAGQGGASGLKQSLWALLETLLGALLAVVAIVALLVAGVFLARRRDRLLARLRALAARYGLVSNADGNVAAVADGEGEAGSVVERAWGEMVSDSGADPPRGDTPRECARAAIDAGLDPEPVEELTELYERVRYGERPVTPDHASRALRWLREASDADGTGLAGDPGQSAAGSTPRDGNAATRTGREGPS